MPKVALELSDMLADLSQRPGPQMVVVGDLMLDQYVWGSADRVSPEAPVIVLRVQDQDVRLGGAASVGHLLRALGAQVALSGVVGADHDRQVMLALLKEDSINSSAVLTDSNRPTTCKRRFIGRADSRHAHQIFRADYESTQFVNGVLRASLVASIWNHVESAAAILVPDYGKGVCEPGLLKELFAMAAVRRVPVIVDPARGVDWERYHGAYMIKPNRRECELTIGSEIRCVEEAKAAAKRLRTEYDFEVVAVTLDRDGIIIADKSGLTHVPTSPHSVYDVTGAGDMVLAMLGVCVAHGVEISVAAELANLAAGLEIEQWGVSAVTWSELQRTAAAKRLSSRIVSLSELSQRLSECRCEGTRIVFTNGCFDLLHAGHISCLANASQLGDVLVVAVNSDRSIQRLKGQDRPIIPELERTGTLAALRCVDYVVVFDDDTPQQILESIRPDVLVKGASYAASKIVGKEFVESYGGTVSTVAMVDGVSTTNIVNDVGAALTSPKTTHSRTSGASSTTLDHASTVK